MKYEDIGKYIFDCTCFACPEQYDVYLPSDTFDELVHVAYVRLRFGNLTVECPDVGGTLVYRHYFDEDYKGDFDSEKERMQYLTLIAQKIKDYYAAHD